VPANESHTLRASLKGRRDWSTTFKLKVNERLALSGSLTPLEVRPPPPTGRGATLVLQSRPPGASFFLDGTAVDDRVEIEAGRAYEITAKLSGHRDFTDKVRARPGEKKTVVARLTRLSVTPPVGEGKAKLSLQSTPWAVVYVDGQKVGQTPIVDHPITSGPHEIRLVNTQLDITKDIQIQAQPGEAVKKNVEFEKGFLNVIAKPWAHVSVAGRKIGTTPFDKKEMYEGTYTVVLDNPTLGRSEEKRVTIKAGQTATVNVDFLQ
jgi:hypothetical protein